MVISKALCSRTLKTLIIHVVLFDFVIGTNEETYTTADGKLCYKCSPGDRLIGDCQKEGTRASCGPCESGTFQNYYSRSLECILCAEQCQEKAELIANCSRTADLDCECISGYYKMVFDETRYTCKQHKQCPPGEGVQKNGTPSEDVVCEPCPDGFFSDVSSSTEGCNPHTQCDSRHVTQGGSKTKDVHCLTTTTTTATTTTTKTIVVSTPLAPSPPDDTGLKVGIIVGVVIGIVLLLIVLVWIIYRRCKKQSYIPDRCKCCVGDSNDERTANINDETELHQLQGNHVSGQGQGIPDGADEENMQETGSGNFPPKIYAISDPQEFPFADETDGIGQPFVSGGQGPGNQNVADVGDLGPGNQNVADVGGRGQGNQNVADVGDLGQGNQIVADVACDLGPGNQNVADVACDLGPGNLHDADVIDLGPWNQNVAHFSDLGPGNLDSADVGGQGPGNQNVADVGDLGPGNQNVADVACDLGPGNQNVADVIDLGPGNQNVADVIDLGPRNQNVVDVIDLGPGNQNVAHFSDLGPGNQNVADVACDLGLRNQNVADVIDLGTGNQNVAHFSDLGPGNLDGADEENTHETESGESDPTSTTGVASQREPTVKVMKPLTFRKFLIDAKIGKMFRGSTDLKTYLREIAVCKGFDADLHDFDKEIEHEYSKRGYLDNDNIYNLLIFLQKKKEDTLTIVCFLEALEQIEIFKKEARSLKEKYKNINGQNFNEVMASI